MQEVHEQILKVLTSFYGTPTADQRDHIASMAGAVMGEAVAPEVERLRAELTRRQDVNRIVAGERDAWKTRTAEAKAERDLLRETLAESDLGALTLAQWEAIAAADRDRDRLEGELAEATTEHAHQYRMAGRFMAERDALKAASAKVNEAARRLQDARSAGVSAFWAAELLKLALALAVPESTESAETEDRS